METGDSLENYIWVPPKKDTKWINEIVSEFNIHPIVAQILLSRGFDSLESVHDFLYAKLPSLHPPNLMHDMDKAITRVVKAIKAKETILIYGDNDVDGMTGTALLVDFLRQIGGQVLYYVPNRTNISSTMIDTALDFSLKNNCTLIITVDCGITAAKEIKEIVTHQIDVIVTDHHEPTEKIPHCIATLNPKLHNSTYPNRDLTGVGVAFKLAHGLTNYLVMQKEIAPKDVDLKSFLDLVALGTVADMGTLLGENRILVRYGLKQFALTKRVGLVNLLKTAEVDLESISTLDIASKIAPRLNSLGRIDDPQKGVDLLLIEDIHQAADLAKELEANNLARQQIERQCSETLDINLQNYANLEKSKAIVLYSDEIHPGVIPIICARIAKSHNRPTVIIAIDGDLGKGSLRTIKEFPLLPALKELKHLLLSFGGHDFAAGLTIKKEHIEEFTQSFSAIVDKTLKTSDILYKLSLDSPVHFKELTFDFMQSLELLEPFGTGNPPPLFFADVVQAWAPKIVGKTHLKLFLDQDERMLEGIGFGLSDMRKSLCKKHLRLEIVFTPHINMFLNKPSIQLLIKDLKIKKPT
ncbi:single-stranded-DNA-specific exonuclease RecJ [Candidatus Aerophobetes bacterium]|uniref:Single-stranded-DNA-specific exonuclease RecJ n=1 Tax=Aerophobetes bacterium TaxID=2030807 RepID=A0A2A4X127_UNCAE|nr:MAG: single-stranded-DNA-specific exonuclease RecJ [Candidatus Aerophobetes bacterium]